MEVFVKKFLVVLVLLAVVAFSVSAQTGFFVGGKLGLGPGFHSLADLNSSDDPSFIWAFTAGAVAGYTFVPKVSVVSGVDFYFGQGVEFSQGKDRVIYTSADLPVLVRYEFLQNLKNHFNFGIEAGPYLSIPLYVYASGWKTVDTEGVNFGITGGVFGSCNLGSGRIIGGLRFLFDFSPLKIVIPVTNSVEDVLTRRELIFSFGYEFTFGGLRKRSS
jgi:hypothetical protein